MNEDNNLHNSQNTEQRASSNGAPESVTEEHYRVIFENSPVSSGKKTSQKSRRSSMNSEKEESRISKRTVRGTLTP